MEDVKKEAKKLFEDDEFTRAYKLYSQLVANFPKDPEYNYRLGVCMLYSEPNKQKCLPYLKSAAAAKPGDAPRDVNFYLGKAYHVNYLFDEAIKCYNDFKKTAPQSVQRKLQADREISACNNGKQLLSNLSDLVVLNKKTLNEADYFRSYDLKTIGGKLLVKPEEFKTSADKKKKNTSVVYLPKASNVVYYSSYGENSETGKDIYTVAKLPSGMFGKPQKVTGINTEFDEDYPFLHPDGKTLYFASKGHNSMGGFDVFKSVFNEKTNTWSRPQNLEFPINSPDDDFLFVTDSLEKTAFFSTGRQSVPGKIDVLKINTERKPIDVLVIKGTVVKETEEQSTNSIIEIKFKNKEIHVGTFEAKENGDYLLELPNGSQLVFTVQTPGLSTQSQVIELPLATTSKPYRQTIAYEKGILKIINQFDESGSDSSYLHYLKVIEKKARLEVNEGQNQLSVPVAASVQAVADTGAVVVNTKEKKETRAQVIMEEPAIATNSNTAKPGINNKQLATVAKQDAGELMHEAAQMKRDAKEAMETGSKQKAEAEKKLTEAEEALNSAESISNEEEKKSMIARAEQLKKSGENDQIAAERIIGFAKLLENDAAAKEKDAELNLQYANELELNSTSKNKNESLVKIEALQKQISEGATRKNESENAVNSIRHDIEQKEIQLVQSEKTNDEIKSQLVEINSAIGSKEEELKQTRKKARKEEISKQISELKADKTEKENQITVRSDEIVELNDELNALKYQLELTTHIKAGDISNVAAPAQTSTATTIPVGESSLSATQPQEKSPNTTQNENAPANTTNYYNPITAANAAEATTKLDELDKQLNFNDKENFDFDGYQNTKAQALKIEANARLNDAITQEKKLKDQIAAHRVGRQITTQPDNADAKLSSQISQLTKNADDLHEQATQKLEESKNKEGSEKEKLRAESRELEEKSDAKRIELAEITKKNNSAGFNVNKENIENLIRQNKAPLTDASEARKLSDEAQTAFKQAQEIREEVVGQTNSGAILGNLSNAEEKEAEAILKQQQAVDLLKKANPTFALKNAPGTANPGDNNKDSIINSINNNLNELATIKIDSYQKLSNANGSELEELETNIKDRGQIIDANPNIKSEYIVAAKKLEEANSLKQKADTSAGQSEKLGNLIASVKKQNEALKQLNAINGKLVQAANQRIATNTNSTIANNETETTKTSTEQTVSSVPDKTNTVSGNNSTTTLNNSEPTATNTNTIALANSTLNPADIVKNDTTSGQLLNYLDKATPALKSQQANKMLNEAVIQLKSYETEITDIDNKINNADVTDTLIQNNTDIQDRVEELTSESDELSTQAIKKRQEAENQNAAEKETLLAEAKELEDQSLDKNIEAAQLQFKASELNETNNNVAIDEMMGRLRNDNPELSVELVTKRNEINTLKSQSQNLRLEAEKQENKAARLGALNNAQERELEFVQQQEQLVAALKKQYPDYVMPTTNALASQSKGNLQQKKEELRLKQFNALTNLTNAFSLEYETLKNNIPDNLNDDAEKTKENTQNLSAESKRQLVKSAQEKNAGEKMKLLSRAAGLGAKAIEELHKITSATAVAPRDKASLELEAIGSQIAASNPAAPPTNTPKEKAVGANAAKRNKATLRIEGLEVTPGNAYNDARPIPLNVKIEDGLVFRVQIGAFKTQIPNNAFKGLNPLNGETTANGYYRYTAGNFNKYENANAVKNDLRNLGYNDAFVVAYYNGKRISMGEAIDLLTKEGRSIDPNAPQSAGITANVNVPKATVNPVITERAVVNKELEKVNGLLYTVQIGVYNKQVTAAQLRNLKPIFTERLPGGLYRYTTGIYNNANRIIVDKRKVVELGVNDAFISAYLNGKKIGFTEAKNKQTTDSSIKMENEEPIIFPVTNNDNTATNTTPAANVTPFTNDVNAYPAATPNNGIKTTQEGICFKVQIGAYSKQVPEDVAAQFNTIRTWPVEYKFINGLYIYNIGNFSEPGFAKTLKEEVIKLGIQDAFITVYNNGNKLYGAEASSYLGR